VGRHEPVHGLGIGLAAFGPPRPGEEGPHRGLPGLDLRIVAVLQHLDPRDRPSGKACLTCCSMRSATALSMPSSASWPAIPCGLPDNGNARIARRRLTFPPRNRTDRTIDPITQCLALVTALRQMPQARWQRLGFSGTGQSLTDFTVASLVSDLDRPFGHPGCMVCSCVTRIHHLMIMVSSVGLSPGKGKRRSVRGLSELHRKPTSPRGTTADFHRIPTASLDPRELGCWSFIR
jgi:hypothetical protein